MKDMPSSDAGHSEAMHAFAELALITVNGDSPEQTLRRIAELAKQTLDAEDVSLTVIDQGRPHSVVFTGSLAVDLDERQYEIGFGPCLDAAKTGQTITVGSNDDTSPYREFARTAARAGVRRTISVGMPLGQRSIGGLNIYTTADAPLGPRFLQEAEVFAGYAAVSVNNIISYAGVAAEAANLRIAMQSRAVIEQAKGILIARDRCTADEAFDLLQRISQNQNMKLHNVAQAVVDAAQK